VSVVSGNATSCDDERELMTINIPCGDSVGLFGSVVDVEWS